MQQKNVWTGNLPCEFVVSNRQNFHLGPQIDLECSVCVGPGVKGKKKLPVARVPDKDSQYGCDGDRQCS